MPIVWEPRPGGGSARVVTDRATAKRWRVWARSASHRPRAEADQCLVFDGGDIVRRVWPVPENWASLTDEALLELAARRPGA